MDSLMKVDTSDNREDLLSRVVKDFFSGKREKLTVDSALELLRQADFYLEIRYDTESKEEIAIFSPKNGIKQPQALPVKQILKKANSLYEIRDCVPIDDRLFPLIREIVDHLQQRHSQTYTHRKIGFTSFSAIQMFLYEKAIGPKKMQEYDFYYSGKLDLRSKGSSEDMLCFIREHVIGNRCLEIALITAFAGVVTQALKLNWTLNLALYIDSYGIQKLLSYFMLGMICNPQNTVQSFAEFNGQKGSGEIQRLQELMVIPCCVISQVVEESGLESIGKNMVAVFHDILLEQQKCVDFMNADHDGNYCSPIAFFLPEQLSSSFATGLGKDEYFSLLELRFEDCEKIQQYSRELERLLRKNHAVMMEPFVHYLFDSENLGDTLFERYDDIVQKLISVDNDSYWPDLCDRMALILLTEGLLNEAFGLHCNVAEMETYLIEQAKAQINTCKDSKYYEDILREYLKNHQDLFDEHDDEFGCPDTPKSDHVGVVETLPNNGIKITIPTKLIGKVFHVPAAEEGKGLSDEKKEKENHRFLDRALESLDQAGIIQHKHKRGGERFCYRKLGFAYDVQNMPCYIFHLE